MTRAWCPTRRSRPSWRPRPRPTWTPCSRCANSAACCDFSACDTTAATPETPWMSRELAIGDATVRIAVASGLENTSKLLDALESGEAAFDFVEIMACPGGCVGGGGQPIQFNSELAQARAGVLNRLDAADKLRYSHENPDIAKLYADWIGEPLSHTAHEWLHTDQESWQI